MPKLKKASTLLILAAMLMLSACNNAAKLQEYDFKTDKIPSINSIIGQERKVSGVATGTGTDGTYKTYTYEADEPLKDIQTYIDELQARGWVVTILEGDNISGKVQIGIESKDEGKILLVTIEYSTSSYKLDARKATGTLNRY
ncbi:MAG: hypothetical protein FWG30_07675 [Eubacteriaceae bacterium]|nr:hypothetical protein [Eubacteriaceae bacterium]